MLTNSTKGRTETYWSFMCGPKTHLTHLPGSMCCICGLQLRRSAGCFC